MTRIVGRIARIAALLCLARPAHAAPSTELRWQAPSACPAEPKVRTAVERLLGQPIATERKRRISVIATVQQSDATWTLTIFTVTPDGTQERTLRHHRDCALLADAAAVLIAMAIDPTVLARLDAQALALVADPPAPDPTPAPTAPVEPAPLTPATPEPATLESAPATPEPAPSSSKPAPAPPDPAPPARPPLHPRGAARLFGSLGFGDLPGIGGGLGGALALRLGRWQLDLGAAGWFLRRVALAAPDMPGATFDLWVLSLRGGPVFTPHRRVELPLQLGIEAGQIRVRGVRLIDAADTRSPWLAATLSTGVNVLLHRALALVIGLDGFVPAFRPAYVVEGAGRIHRPLPVGVRVQLGLEVRFP